MSDDRHAIKTIITELSADIRPLVRIVSDCCIAIPNAACVFMRREDAMRIALYAGPPPEPLDFSRVHNFVVCRDGTAPGQAADSLLRIATFLWALRATGWCVTQDPPSGLVSWTLADYMPWPHDPAGALRLSAGDYLATHPSLLAGSALRVSARFPLGWLLSVRTAHHCRSGWRLNFLGESWPVREALADPAAALSRVLRGELQPYVAVQAAWALAAAPVETPQLSGRGSLI